ncbi:hypothetical protein Dtox_2924 [Desulfofarcimen acetoxidans DSM 771]|jgi:hypothetical protein|uniref:Uncharacterized protein n=1 Tax=Desulfofarcimen acetoxidans (strain ATCC 49208 / DSM 771 / KCTC 5769 / VKM B-1644 / 5575) TaxID=485916 RepID=C8W2J6_DESAS|nr:hypothetical protein [Desulfofarcimen acetoxidans]ACV63680.1 hypothetical protein Dtox_2924 [Desulfofarcimen acetoxidans DSM 771]
MLPQNNPLKKVLVIIAGIFAVILISKLIFGIIKFALIIAVIGAVVWFISKRLRG